MADNTEYDLLVPTGAAARMMEKGSAVVGRRCEGGHDCRYEGAVHFPMPWEDKVIHAADRLSTGYPTSAMAFLGPDEAKVVGTVSRDHATGDWVVSDIEDQDALRQWRDGHDTMIGASEAQRQRKAGMLLSRGGSRMMATYAKAKARGADPIASILAAGR